MSERVITQIFLRSHAKAKATSATDKSGTMLLRQGFALMEKSEAPVAPQTLVLGAEAAVANLAFGDAQRMTRQYFLREPARDQFYCRALFVHALEEAKEARRFAGMAAVEQLLKSISFIERVLDIALLPANRVEYAFLVYNASVHLWNICRPLMRDGARKHYAKPFQRIIDGLETVNELDEKWRVKLLIALSTAYLEVEGSGDAAQTSLRKAIEMLRALPIDEDTVALRAHTRRLVLHVGDGPDSGASGKALVGEIESGMDDGHTSEALMAVDRQIQSVRSLRAGEAGEAEGSFIEDILDSLDAMLESIHAAARGAGEEKEEGGAGGADATPGAGAGEGHGASLDVAALERVLIRHMQTALLVCKNRHRSTRILMRTERVVVEHIGTIKSGKPELQVLRDYVKSQVLLIDEDELNEEAESAAAAAAAAAAGGGAAAATASRPGTAAASTRAANSDAKTRRMLALRTAKRIEAMNCLSRALTTCVRLDNPELLHQGATFVWNTAIPLMQPRYRKHLQLVFQIAVDALEAIDSPLLAMRAQLHLELANCELEMDFVSKANLQVKKAIALDHGFLSVEEDESAAAAAAGGDSPKGGGGAKKGKEKADSRPGSKAGSRSSSPTKGGGDSGAASTEPMAIDDSLQALITNYTRRPLDRYLRPLQKRLALKAAVFVVPEDKAEQALLLIEQATTDGAELFLQASLLARAVALLEEDAPLVPAGTRPGSAADVLRITLWDRASTIAIKCSLKAQLSESRSVRGATPKRGAGAAKDDVDVGARSVSSAIALQLQSVIEKGAQHILSLNWGSDQFREHIVIQINARLRLAELALMRLSSPEMAALAHAPGGASTTDGSDPRCPGLRCEGTNAAQLLALKEDAIRNMSEALTQSMKLEEASAALPRGRGKQGGIDEARMGIRNCAVYVWNMHREVFRHGWFSGALDSLLALLGQTEAALRGVVTVANGQGTLREKSRGPSMDDKVVIEMYCSLCVALGRLHETRGELADTIAVCERGVGFANAAAATDLLTLLARARLAKGDRGEAILASQTKWQAVVVTALALLNFTADREEGEGGQTVG